MDHERGISFWMEKHIFTFSLFLYLVNLVGGSRFCSLFMNDIFQIPMVLMDEAFSGGDATDWILIFS